MAGSNSVKPSPDAPSGTHRVDEKRETTPQTAATADAPQPEPYRKVVFGTLGAVATLIFGYYFYWLTTAQSLSAAAGQTTQWLTELSGPGRTAYAVMLGPALLLLLGLLAVSVKLGLPNVWQSARRSLLLGVLLGACLLAAGLLSSGRLDNLSRLQWLFFIPIIPPVLLGYQALVVWRQRPRSLGRLSIGAPRAVVEALQNDGTLDRFDNVHRQLLRVFGGTRPAQPSAKPGGSAMVAVEGGAYNPTYFVTNFAVPALLLLLVGFGAISMAVHDSLDGLAPSKNWDSSLAARGLRWGVAGAFVYVLTEFGARFFRNDLTVGAAVWGIITLIVGPALAVALAIAWKMEAGTSPWQSGIVLFFAGLAPRRVVSIVESVALQLLKAPTDATVPSKSVPLTSLRGLTSEVAVRLREENVHDVSTLAYADPVRLVLSLPYDLRQIVDWLDQAQLAVACPQQFDALRDAGVTGAIDLSWRWMTTALKQEGGTTVLDPEAPLPGAFKHLVANPDRDASALYETARQLFYEEQVCQLWVMYNCFSTTAGSMGGNGDALPILSSPSKGGNGAGAGAGMPSRIAPEPTQSRDKAANE
jgi:hypothetical protein